MIKAPKLFALAVAICTATTAAFAQSEPVTVFKRGEEGYNMFRIPAVIQAANGDILAFCEGRNGRGDTGEIDMVMKRSSDGGRTWGKIQVIWKDGKNTCGNPAPVVENKSGRIIMVATWNDGRDHESDIRMLRSIDTRRVFCFYSDDNGVSWSTPVEITSTTKLPEWTWYATGPCHAIQLQKGDHKGRLVVPCNHGTPPEIKNGKEWARTVSHIIYSDDMGDTWHIGGNPDVGNESTVAELRDGRIVLNMRVDGSHTDDWRANGRCRQVAYSADGGESFGAPFFERGLPEPRCQGTIANYTRKGKLTNSLLFCNPASGKRDNMWLKLSTDGGNTWKEVCRIYEGKAAYSDIFVARDGSVGVLYENGDKGIYDRISFVVVDASVIKKASKNQPIIR